MIPSQRTLKLLIPLVVLIALSCTNNRKLEKEEDKTEVQINEYTAKYAGGYTVELEGVNSDDAAEIYILRNDGSAKWIYLKMTALRGVKLNLRSQVIGLQQINLFLSPVRVIAVPLQKILKLRMAFSTIQCLVTVF